MRRKEIKLRRFNPTKQQLSELFEISLSIFDVARHDLNNLLSALAGNSQLALIHFQALEEQVLSKQKRKGCEDLFKLGTRLREAVTINSRLLQACDRFLRPYGGIWTERFFISCPFKIIDALRTHLSHPEIIIDGRSQRTLEILFPENILFGILSELIANAGRSGQGNIKALVRWKVQGKTFKCEVHDNGSGISKALGRKFVPLDALTIDAKQGGNGQGLIILNKILIKAKGILLFANSKLLGGTLVYFEFPLMGYYKKGMWNG